MSDAEHSLLVDLGAVRAELAQVRAVARRALLAALDAQEAHGGRHDAWIDDGLRDLAAAEAVDE